MKNTQRIFLTLVCIFSVFSGSCWAFDLGVYGFQPVEAYDFEGETVTIISWTSERMDGYFNDYLPVSGRVAEAEELFNCKIEWMQIRDIPEVNFNRLLSGESVNDLWHVQNKIGYWELVAGNAAYPMGELLGDEYYSNLSSSHIATEEALKYRDQYWGIGPVEWRPIYGYQNDLMVVVYNKTLFEREGLPDLYELYQNNEWTWDMATEIAIKATADLDGDGVIDQWGIIDARPWDLAVSNGASMTKVDKDGKIVFTGDEPAYLRALEQIKLWWTDLEVQLPSYSSGTLGNTFYNGQGAMLFSASVFGLENVANSMVDEWALVPFPMGPDTDHHYWTVQALNTTLIPVNAKNPEALAALRTFMWREEDVTVSDFLAAHAPNQESADILITANSDWGGDASRLFEVLLGEFVTYTRDISSGTKNAAAAMAEIKPIIQANLNDLFDQ